jgi:hypothetical protein
VRIAAKTAEEKSLDICKLAEHQETSFNAVGASAEESFKLRRLKKIYHADATLTGKYNSKIGNSK